MKLVAAGQTHDLAHAVDVFLEADGAFDGNMGVGSLVDGWDR